MARPTKLSKAIKNQALDYVVNCTDTIEHFEGENGRHWETVRVKLPTIEGLARYLNIARSTLYLWQKEDGEFSDIIEDLQVEQVDRLINMGLQGAYNPTIAKVLLSKHNYTEKQEIGGPDGQVAVQLVVMRSADKKEDKSEEGKGRTVNL